MVIATRPVECFYRSTQYQFNCMRLEDELNNFFALSVVTCNYYIYNY
ncbi:hypothetical protein MUGA111182_19320 [Mucilaginibacter galii]